MESINRNVVRRKPPRAQLAERIQISPKAFIDRVVAALMLRHRAEAATLRAGVTGALDAAREAARDVWEECA